MKIVTAFILLITFAGASFNTTKEKEFVEDNFTFANTQIRAMIKEATPYKHLFPRTVNQQGELVLTGKYEWTSGFFPGSLWYLYEAKGSEYIKQEAVKWTEQLDSIKTYTDHHDIGFMMYCSYGNAYRLTRNDNYKKVLIQSAQSLSTRFNSITGSIKSWNAFGSWDAKGRYNFPVIIDNMMNLELLFFASKITGDPRYKNIAVMHARNVARNQVREDYSCYHVVCYDTATGKVLSQETSQGYANNSTWARGQAWGIYGFTMVYRETRDKAFLDIAQKMADYYLNNVELPSDKIPYWDFYANKTGYTPSVRSKAPQTPVKFRDASAAAITASALFELSEFLGGAGSQYKSAAIDILHSLSSPAYRAQTGTNGNFILKHSVGSIPHGSEIDVPLVYADYYYLEALSRYRNLLTKQSYDHEKQ